MTKNKRNDKRKEQRPDGVFYMHEILGAELAEKLRKAVRSK